MGELTNKQRRQCPSNIFTRTDANRFLNRHEKRNSYANFQRYSLNCQRPLEYPNATKRHLTSLTPLQSRILRLLGIGKLIYMQLSKPDWLFLAARFTATHGWKMCGDNSLNTHSTVKRRDYEMCTLSELRDGLRCRAFWLNSDDIFKLKPLPTYISGISDILPPKPEKDRDNLT